MSARTLFLVAMGVVGLHIADDSFLQPQPGTSAGDHLISGLVPLGAMALAVVAYLKGNEGIRGAIALVAGFCGLVAAAEAVYYTAELGPSGDDFTGLLCVPAGLALIGLGVHTLWSSRRRDGHVAGRVARRSLMTVGGVLFLLLVLAPLGMAYVLSHVARTPVEEIDLGTANVEDVQLHTRDGHTLEGSYVPSRNGAAVIVAFGRLKTQPHARMLIEHGYGALIFDRRGEGESDGDPNPYAWDEGERDIHAAVEFLQSRPEVDPDRIGGLGLSVGGETLLQAAARSEDLAAVVSEGAGSRSVGELMSIPGYDLGPVIFNVPVTAGIAVFADNAPPEHLIDQVDEIAPRPSLFIYAGKDAGGEEKRANSAYADAAGDSATLWGIPEAGHVGGLEAQPEDYEERVTQFFDEALLGKDQ